MRRRTVVVNDKMQRGYRHELTARQGRDFDPELTPDLTPQEMPRLGVFGGKYMTDTRGWFTRARLASGRRDLSGRALHSAAPSPLSSSGLSRGST